MNPQGLLGIGFLLLVAWALSEDRRGISWRLVVGGLALQGLLAGLLFGLPPVRGLFLLLNRAVAALDEATMAGTSFVFGYLGGGPLPFETTAPGANFILAFRALPLILVISALSSLLFHWRILPALVGGFSALLSRTLGIGGALGVAAAANVFVGMVEAPVLVRPWVARLERGELFAMMTCGMATIAGTMMVLYATILGPVIPDALGHILTASIINVPAALVIAGLMVPVPGAGSGGGADPEHDTKSAMDAITAGTAAGLRLLANVAAMLVVLVALVALVNLTLGLLPEVADAPLTLQRLLGWLLAPLAWLLGIPWADAPAAGALMGTRLVLNEFIAYLDLAGETGAALSDRSRQILVYAMCGFANLGSLGIMIGGMAGIAPGRRAEIAALGPKAVLAGFMATSATGALIGLFL